MAYQRTLTKCREPKPLDRYRLLYWDVDWFLYGLKFNLMLRLTYVSQLYLLSDASIISWELDTNKW
jgi:hypothetical protein